MPGSVFRQIHLDDFMAEYKEVFMLSFSNLSITSQIGHGRRRTSLIRVSTNRSRLRSVVTKSGEKDLITVNVQI